MKMLLTLAGYTPYQAACIAPLMWAFLIGAIVYAVAMNPKASATVKKI